MAPSAITTTAEEYGTLSLKTISPAIYPSLPHAEHEILPAKDVRRNGISIAKQMIGDALQKRVQDIDEDVCEAGDEDAFFVADMGEIYRQHLRWKKNLARVKPHYGQSTSHFDCTFSTMYSH